MRGRRVNSPEVTQDELEALCATWQRRLRLQDWRVKIRFARSLELGADTQGDCDWSLTKKMAAIRILVPGDYPPDASFSQDIEQTVVHELLHLHGAPFDRFACGSADDNAVEVMIDCTAQALVAGYRNREG